MIRSPTFIRTRRRTMLRGALAIAADFGRLAPRPAPHRAWGTRAAGIVKDQIHLRALLEIARRAHNGDIPVIALDVDATGPSVYVPGEGVR